MVPEFDPATCFDVDSNSNLHDPSVRSLEEDLCLQELSSDLDGGDDFYAELLGQRTDPVITGQGATTHLMGTLPGQGGSEEDTSDARHSQNGDTSTDDAITLGGTAGVVGAAVPSADPVNGQSPRRKSAFANLSFAMAEPLVERLGDLSLIPEPLYFYPDPDVEPASLDDLPLSPDSSLSFPVKIYTDRSMDILHSLGYESFRPGQYNIILGSITQHHMLGVLSTGGGKTLTYLLPPVLLNKCALVVTPTVALRNDQMRTLSGKTNVLQVQTMGDDGPGIVPVGNLVSRVTSLLNQDNDISAEPSTKRLSGAIVFCTPEKLINDPRLREQLMILAERRMLCMLVVDECHLVLDWGDFRPEFLSVAGAFREISEHCLFKIPYLLLSATLPKPDQVSLTSHFQFGEKDRRFVGQIFRPNLRLHFVPVEPKSKSAPRDSKMELVRRVVQSHRNQAGIIYCRKKTACDEMASFLNNLFSDNPIQEETFAKSDKAGKTGRTPRTPRTSRGDSRSADVVELERLMELAAPGQPVCFAASYHGEKSKAYQRLVLQLWTEGRIKVICASIAFGLGIDFPDVRYVVDVDMSAKITILFQKIGRAGRDGKPSDCYLPYRKEDINAVMYLATIPSQDERSFGPPQRSKRPLTPSQTRIVERNLREAQKLFLLYLRTNVCKWNLLMRYYGQCDQQDTHVIFPASTAHGTGPERALDHLPGGTDVPASRARLWECKCCCDVCLMARGVREGVGALSPSRSGSLQPGLPSTQPYVRIPSQPQTQTQTLSPTSPLPSVRTSPLQTQPYASSQPLPRVTGLRDVSFQLHTSGIDPSQVKLPRSRSAGQLPLQPVLLPGEIKDVTTTARFAIAILYLSSEHPGMPIYTLQSYLVGKRPYTVNSEVLAETDHAEPRTGESQASLDTGEALSQSEAAKTGDSAPLSRLINDALREAQPPQKRRFFPLGLALQVVFELAEAGWVVLTARQRASPCAKLASSGRREIRRLLHATYVL